MSQASAVWIPLTVLSHLTYCQTFFMDCLGFYEIRLLIFVGLPRSTYFELQSLGSMLKKATIMHSDSISSSLRMKQNWAENGLNIPVILCPSGPNPKCCILGKDDFLIMLKAPQWTWLLTAFVWPWVNRSFLIHHFPSCLMKFVIFLSPVLCLSCLFRLSSCVRLGARLK